MFLQKKCVAQSTLIEDEDIIIPIININISKNIQNNDILDL